MPIHCYLYTYHSTVLLQISNSCVILLLHCSQASIIYPLRDLRHRLFSDLTTSLLHQEHPDQYSVPTRNRLHFVLRLLHRLCLLSIA